MYDSDNPGKDLHEASKNRYQPDFAPLPSEEWPDEWKVISYKSYPRFESYSLPLPDQTTPLAQIQQRRKSERNFTKQGISTETLSNLLQATAGMLTRDGESERRVYGSGGARYPIEVYIILRNSSDSALTPGVYHYNVADHTLEFLWNEKEDRPPLLHDTWAEEADAIFVMTGVFARSTNKYKNNGYRFVYIDAGAILQNLYLYAASIPDLKVTGYRGTNDDIIEDLLRLNTEQESLIVSALIGT